MFDIVFKNIKSNNQFGTTLIEILIYVSILVIVLTSSFKFFSDVLLASTNTQQTVSINSNLRLAMEKIIETSKDANSIDVSTSIFDNNDGHISLNTSSGIVEFYLDDNKLLFSEEGVDPSSLLSNDIIVDAFNITLIEAYSVEAPDSLRVRINAHSDSHNDDSTLLFALSLRK